MSLSDDFKERSAIAKYQHDLSFQTVCDALTAIALQDEGDIEQEAAIDCLYEQQNECEKILYDTVKNQGSHTVIFASVVAFNGVKQRYQSLATALARLGQKVIYVNPAIEADVPEEISLEEALNYIIEKAYIEEGVIVFQPITISKYGIYTYLPLLKMLADAKSNPVFISSINSVVFIADYLKERGMLIYDCADDHSDYQNAFWTSEEAYSQFCRLEEKADAILTTSSSLFLTKLREHQKPVFLSRNAVSASEFNIGQPPVILEDIARIPEPRIGYVGVVYQRFDKELFYELAKNNPDKSFVVVGVIHDNWITAKYPNIYLFGHKAHEELYNYYKAMDICLIPYKDDAKMSVACDPVKIYEQIACNVPTITTFMPDTAIGKPLVWHADTYEEMQADIDEILTERPTLSIEEIEEFLLENSWHVRAAQLVRIVENKIVDTETPEYTLSELTQEFEILKDYHPNFEILYALCCQKANPKLYKELVEHAYSLSKAPFIEEEYHLLNGYKKEFGHTLIDIFNPPADLPQNTWVEIMWFNTFWCNNNCDYCHEVHDRAAGHAFDTATPEEWAMSINRIKVPFILNISGGETFLDHKNFVKFYNLVIDNPMLIRVRIDTNTTIPAQFLKDMKLERTSLMTSYHPSRHTVQESISAIKSYEELGFEISMVNYVCQGKRMKEFRELQPVFEKEKLTLAASIYFGNDANNDNETLQEYMKSLDKKDIGFKTCFQTKGLPCHAASHLLMLDYNGCLRNCWGEKWNLFNNHAMISLAPRSCPMSSCDCITKYSMLDVAGRDMSHSLDDYIETYANGNKTKIILITGFFGYGNFGDELLLEALLEKLRGLQDVLPIALCFGNPEKVAKQHNVIAVSLFDEKRIAMLTCLCDALILGPGGLLEDYKRLDPKEFYSHNGLYSYLYPVVMAQLNGKAAYSIGLGAGPFAKEETKNAVRMALRDMKLIFVRDKYSADSLCSCGLSQAQTAADMAFTYPFERYCHVVEANTIGINLRSHITLDIAKMLREMCQFIVLAIASGYKIKLLALQEMGDKEMLDTLMTMLNKVDSRYAEHIRIVVPKTVEETIAEISSVEIMTAMRLHANIASACCNVPSIFISYDRKVSEAAQILGMEDYVIEAKELDGNILFQKTMQLLENKKEIMENVSEKCQKLKKTAEESVDCLIKTIV